MKKKAKAEAEEMELGGHAMDDSEGSESMDDAVAEGHMRTLMEAHKIRSDHKKMNRVRKLAGRHRKLLADIESSSPVESEKPGSLEDLQKIYNKKFGAKRQ